MPESANAVVEEFVTAINAGDKDTVLALFADGASMSDDGSERNLAAWLDREMFTTNGRIEIESSSDDGLSLIAGVTNDTWGTMRTRWQFFVDGDKITRFETGQA
ncbi:MAG TPA: nuclear transport factor 2 family protein [Pseudonocardiaceae bacterium]|jgi:hypothetical protein|nr:nuclear transport factor 2 family protein [Pseudonocardiaceae bacterium]